MTKKFLKTFHLKFSISMRKNIKIIFIKLLPPFIFSLIKFIIIKLNRFNKNYDERRFWNGQTVLADTENNFTEYFDDLIKKNIFYVTKEFETKECIKINSGETLNLKLKDFYSLEDIFKISITLDSDKFSERNFLLTSNKTKLIDFKDLKPNRWYNTVLKAKEINKEIKLVNNLNKHLYFSISHNSPSKNSFGNDKKKNIIFILLDDVDKDGFYNAYNDSIYLKKFFKNSIHYKNAYSVAEWTVPSLTSILTGKYPSQHGCFDLDFIKKIKDPFNKIFLLEQLKKNKFNRFAISRSKVHHPGYKFNKHFDRFKFYVDTFDTNVEFDEKIPFDLIENLESSKDQNNFCFVDFVSTHAPYFDTSYSESFYLSRYSSLDPEKEYYNSIYDRGDTPIESYLKKDTVENLKLRQFARLKKLDVLIGHFLSYLNEKCNEEENIVILTADHGPLHLGNKGDPLLNRKRTNVPLLIYNSSKNNAKTEVNDYVSNFKIVNEAINFFSTENEINFNEFYEKNLKSSYIISESIFNDKCKICLRSEDYDFYYHCRFEPNNNLIDFEDKQLEKLDKFNENIIDDLSIIQKSKAIIKEHLNNSKLLKVI